MVKQIFFGTHKTIYFTIDLTPSIVSGRVLPNFYQVLVFNEYWGFFFCKMIVILNTKGK